MSVCAAYTLAASTVMAQDEPREIAVAQELFEQAERAQAAGNWRACEESLTEAIALKETPGLRFHLGFCKEQQSRWVEALLDYRRVAELLEGGAVAPDVAEVLATSMAQLEKNMPKLRLAIPDPPPATRWYLDGREQALALADRNIPVDPGSRELAVSAPGYEDFVFRFNVLPGEERVIEVLLIALKAETGEQPVSGDGPATAELAFEEAQDARPLITPLRASLAVEGVLTLTALGLGIAGSLREADLDDRALKARGAEGDIDCVSPSADEVAPCEHLLSLSRRSEEAHTFANAGYLFAGVGAASLLLTWMLWPESEQAPVQATLSPSPRGFVGSVQLQF